MAWFEAIKQRLFRPLAALMRRLFSVATLLVVPKKVAYKSILKAYCYQPNKCKINGFHCLNNSTESTKSVRLLTLIPLINESGLSTNSTDQRNPLKFNEFSLKINDFSCKLFSFIFSSIFYLYRKHTLRALGHTREGSKETIPPADTSNSPEIN